MDTHSITSTWPGPARPSCSSTCSATTRATSPLSDVSEVLSHPQAAALGRVGQERLVLPAAGSRGVPTRHPQRDRPLLRHGAFRARDACRRNCGSHPRLPCSLIRQQGDMPVGGRRGNTKHDPAAYRGGSAQVKTWHPRGSFGRQSRRDVPARGHSVCSGCRCRGCCLAAMVPPTAAPPLRPRAVHPIDLVATVNHCLGVSNELTLVDPQSGTAAYCPGTRVCDLSG